MNFNVKEKIQEQLELLLDDAAYSSEFKLNKLLRVYESGVFSDSCVDLFSGFTEPSTTDKKCL